MKVKILLNLPRTIDGENIGPFNAGQIVELDDDTARKFIGSAMAVESIDAAIETAATRMSPPPEQGTGAAEAQRAAAEGEARRQRRSQTA